MARKGDLRLLKDGVVFGPTDRAGLEQLLATGRITLADHVSERHASWVSIGDFLAASSPSTKQDRPAEASAAADSGRTKKGDLQVLSGGRVVSSLGRAEVERLFTAGRVGDDDLICVIGGPWMRVADFLAPPAAPEPSAVSRTAADNFPAAAVSNNVPAPLPDIIPAAVMPVDVPAADVPDIVVEILPYMPATIPPGQNASPAVPPLRPSPPQPPPLPARVSVPQPSAFLGTAYPMARQRPPAPPANDEWYVRVRGIYSAPLRKHHVKALFDAREITPECLARHATWHDNDWRPIRSIPALADIVRP